MKKGRTAVDDREDNVRIQEFLDMIAPSVIKFETDHFICGNTSLDLYEGYPNFYDKQMLEIELDGKIVPAMVYVMTPGHSFGIPSDYYSNVIWQGYETAGFETQFLEDAIEHAYQLVQKQEREGDFYQQSLFHMGGYDGMK